TRIKKDTYETIKVHFLVTSTLKCYNKTPTHYSSVGLSTIRRITLLDPQDPSHHDKKRAAQLSEFPQQQNITK
ncbi:hypothetical protein R1A30_22605, partial [Paenibacillus larvae]|uniref:hypothetical protein n=1 Tax=Paenibacillus larvae TaxID=1464 RepID=UPI00293CBDC9